MKKPKPLSEIKDVILKDQESSANSKSEEKTSRRSFLKQIGIGSILLALGGQTYAFLRSLIPNVLYEPPRRFKIGAPDKFAEGGVFLEQDRLFVFRSQNTYHVISAQCTHLGCTVKMQKFPQPKKVTSHGREIEELVEFQCPCHGSKYYGDGTNYAGPAPRPLDYFKLEVSPDDGQLIVDKSQVVGQDFRLTI
jgi:menaquinol-cytochrome c reductase iron-sulfur subunit